MYVKFIYTEPFWIILNVSLHTAQISVCFQADYSKDINIKSEY